MTIDERIEKLTERHEALSMTVELLTRDVKTLRATAEEHNKSLRTDAENIRALVRIAEIHALRLNDRDGRITGLETGT